MINDSLCSLSYASVSFSLTHQRPDHPSAFTCRGFLLCEFEMTKRFSLHWGMAIFFRHPLQDVSLFVFCSPEILF